MCRNSTGRGRGFTPAQINLTTSQVHDSEKYSQAYRYLQPHPLWYYVTNRYCVPSAGDPNCPPEVKRAKAVYHEIEASTFVASFDDDAVHDAEVLDDMVESHGGSTESSCASSPSPGGVGDEAQLRANSGESEHSAEASEEYTDCDAPCCIAEAPHGAGPAAFSASTRNCTTLAPAKQGASGGYRTN
ncbi:unnamed protein product [Phytophthora fragariaefolia]|uniref:Unnamed protein product n=1 Tax=Phytophthora fragariaefolia TaxID=1490495 RepID=A0A9W7DB47_9STRA|nr:unnamed protein product [Phytophthora fragariaefolia]